MSAILSADDLNDFISPGVACIKPIETLPAAEPQPPVDPSLEHEVILDGQPDSQKPGGLSPNAPAQISLTDCLACSGCVTSAEAVLVSLQSHAEVLNVLDSAPALRILPRGQDDADGYDVEGLEDESRKLFVASVSPQTRASLAAACGGGVTERQAGYMLENLLMGGKGLRAGGKYNNDFTWVLDTSVAREACLVLGSDEVLDQGLDSSQPKKPILASSCPGWVCYAEKTHPYVLPHLSRIKSPQALMGTLVKTTLSRKLGISPDRIFHLAIMPCFDKKLEASREELTDAAWDGQGTVERGIRDVDCVITSKEIFMLTQSRGIDFFNLSTSYSPQPTTSFPDATLRKFLFSRRRQKSTPAAGSSGGNLYFVLQDVLSRNPSSTLQTTRGRNVDVIEYTITSSSGKTLFKGARYYGFRNIQNLVRRLKPAQPSRMPGVKALGARRPVGKASSLDFGYVEVMACPGGCTNGGGQVKADDQVVVDRQGLAGKAGPQEQKEWLVQVDEAYFSADDTGDGDDNVLVNGDRRSDEVDGISPSYIRDTLAHWSSMTKIDIDKLVRTSFREVISDVGKPQMTDTERVLQLSSKMDGGW